MSSILSLHPTPLSVAATTASEDGGAGMFSWIWDALTEFIQNFSWGNIITRAIEGFFQSIIGTFVESIKTVLSAVIVNPRTILEFSFVDSLYNVLLVAGVAILILIVAWQSFKAIFVWAGFEADEPWRIAVKSIACGFCVFFAKDILIWMTDLNWSLIDLVLNAHGEANASNLFSAMFVDSTFMGMSLFTMDAIIAIYLIVKIVLAAYKMVERLLLTTILIVMSPLAFACGVADSTKGFLQGFVRLFTGNMVIQLAQTTILCAIFIYQREASAAANFPLNYLAFFVLIGLFKLIGKLEEIVRDMSISVGIGASMGGGAMQKVSTAVYTTQSVVNVIKGFGGG